VNLNMKWVRNRPLLKSAYLGNFNVFFFFSDQPN
jgi:hypothetical protein